MKYKFPFLITMLLNLEANEGLPACRNSFCTSCCLTLFYDRRFNQLVLADMF